MIWWYIISIISIIVGTIAGYFIGKERAKNIMFKKIDDNYFGCMIANLNIQDEDNFVETHFYQSPRELLSREFVIFEVKIRE